jgi:hypothetical protein
MIGKTNMGIENGKEDDMGPSDKHEKEFLGESILKDNSSGDVMMVVYQWQCVGYRHW